MKFLRTGIWMNYLAFDNSCLPCPFNIVEALMRFSCCREAKNDTSLVDRAEYFDLLEKLSNKYITREEDVGLRDITVEDVTNARNEIISQYRHRNHRNDGIEGRVSVPEINEKEDSDDNDKDSELET